MYFLNPCCEEAEEGFKAKIKKTKLAKRSMASGLDVDASAHPYGGEQGIDPIEEGRG